jgi:hypothetical protein
MKLSITLATVFLSAWAAAAPFPATIRAIASRDEAPDALRTRTLDVADATDKDLGGALWQGHGEGGARPRPTDSISTSAPPAGTQALVSGIDHDTAEPLHHAPCHFREKVARMFHSLLNILVVCIVIGSLIVVCVVEGGAAILTRYAPESSSHGLDERANIHVHQDTPVPQPKPRGHPS